MLLLSAHRKHSIFLFRMGRYDFQNLQQDEDNTAAGLMSQSEIVLAEYKTLELSFHLFLIYRGIKKKFLLTQPRNEKETHAHSNVRL